MKKIAVFQKDFQVGGIQKALLNILEELDYSKCAVDVFYFDDELFYQLPSHENLRFIRCRAYPYFFRLVYFSFLKLLAPLKVSDAHYDLAIDFNSYSNECAVAATCASADKRIMWIHNDMAVKYRDERKYRILWHFFKGKFRYFDSFCAVSPGIVDGFRQMTGLRDADVEIIPNLINTEVIAEKAEEKIEFSVSGEKYNLCSMGRLCHQKGFDILLNCMEEIRRRRPDIDLYIIGDGPERKAIEEQIERLNLGSCVTLLGSKKNPFPYLKQMDGFVLTSRYEGQGIVLWEAKSLGLRLFLPKRLEKYNPGLAGSDDVVGEICRAKKEPKLPDDLREYNGKIIDSLKRLIGI